MPGKQYRRCCETPLSLFTWETADFDGMGKDGRITRIAAPLLGAPFTYASLDNTRETASGQLDSRTLKQIIDMIRNS